MTHYRLYFLDDEGRSFRSVPLDCADDAGAVSAADLQTGGRAMQLWAGARVVKHYPGTRPARAS